MFGGDMSPSIFHGQNAHRGILSEGLNFTLAAHMKHWTAQPADPSHHSAAAIGAQLVEI